MKSDIYCTLVIAHIWIERSWAILAFSLPVFAVIEGTVESPLFILGWIYLVVTAPAGMALARVREKYRDKFGY